MSDQSDESLGDEDNYETLRFPTQEEIKQGIAIYPRVGRTTVYERKFKRSGRVYILDDPKARRIGSSVDLGHSILSRTDDTQSVGADDGLQETNTVNDDNSAVGEGGSDEGGSDADDDFNSDPHKLKCDMVRKFFSKHSVYRVVRMKSLDYIKVWEEYWQKETTSWKADELIILYFQGVAGGNGQEWRWKMHGRPRAYEVDAFNFLEQLCKQSKADIFVLGECYYPTRFSERGKLIRTLRRGKHSIEMLCNGQAGQDTSGHLKHINFTDKILSTLFSIIRGEFRQPKHCPLKAFSIPEMMCGERSWDSNPYRGWLTPADGRNVDGQVWRMRIDPAFVKREGKLMFHMDAIRDKRREAELVECQDAAQASEVAAFADRLCVALADEAIDDISADAQDRRRPDDEGIELDDESDKDD